MESPRRRMSISSFDPEEEHGRPNNGGPGGTTTTTTTTASTPQFSVPENLLRRCMRGLRWDEEFATRAVLAYRQFMDLKIRLDDGDATKLAAPPVIRQVWQQHILDVHHYAAACGIHHDPEDGPGAEGYPRRVQTTELALEETGFARIDPEIWSFAAPENGEDDGDEGEGRDNSNKRRRRNDTRNGGHLAQARRSEAITFFVRWAQNDNHQRHNDLYFKIRPDTKMARVFERFNMHWGGNLNGEDGGGGGEDFTFFFGGRMVRPTDTANTIGLLSDDMVSATRCNAVEDMDD